MTKPSIFNDVIGPVMRGPSSSHTAASHRIGDVIRQIINPLKGKVLVEFDRKGSLAYTYEGQGSEMGLTAGLLGLDILDPSMMSYKQLAKDKGLNISFVVSDFIATHPNTYKISVTSKEGTEFKFTAISTGGGMFEVCNINGYDLSVRGDYFETLLFFKDHEIVISDSAFHKIIDNQYVYAGFLHRNNDNEILIQLKSRENISERVRELMADAPYPDIVCQVNPVMPILSGSTEDLPFNTVDEMMQAADRTRSDLSELALGYECARAGIEPGKTFSMMKDIIITVNNSIHEGLKGTEYDDRILGRQSHLIGQAEKDGRISHNPLNLIISYVTAIMESKSAMGVIVAAPTAGSSGVIGGTLFGISDACRADTDSIVRAFLAAGIIGVFIADKYTFAAEEGGCQVECGAASGMAAAGIVQMMGGTPLQAVNAASLALQNMLGLICDPVADRVEVPCLGKNILGATNAYNSAIMSIAGYDPVIPLGEVIEAMKSVGESLPSSLCCTGHGGLSLTPTSARIHNDLKRGRKSGER